jgi:hypothetical protein
MRRAAPLVAACLLAGCGGHRSSSIPVSAARTLVLQPRDLPAGYTSIGSGPQNPFTANSVDAKRYGRKGGWYADYRRPPGATSGPLIVQSQVDVFGDSGGAGRELAAERDRLGTRNAASVPPIGSDSVASKVEGAGKEGAVVYTIVWRERNVTSSLVVTGLRGKLHAPDVARLARRAAAHVGAVER